MGLGSLLLLLGASGGLGTSVLAAAVAARALRAGREVVLVDGCPLGGGLDVTVGAEQVDGIRWADLGGLVGQADAEALLARLPTAHGLPVLSFDRSGREPPDDVTQAVLAALSASGLFVVVDAALSSAVCSAARDVADRIVLVAGEGVRQVAALSVVADRVVSIRSPAGDEPPGLISVCLRSPSRRSLEVGAVARLVETELSLPVQFALPDDDSVAADLVHGVAPGTRGTGPLVRTADEILAWAIDPVRRAA